MKTVLSRIASLVMLIIPVASLASDFILLQEQGPSTEDLKYSDYRFVVMTDKDRVLVQRNSDLKWESHGSEAFQSTHFIARQVPLQTVTVEAETQFSFGHVDPGWWNFNEDATIVYNGNGTYDWPSTDRNPAYEDLDYSCSSGQYYGANGVPASGLKFVSCRIDLAWIPENINIRISGRVWSTFYVHESSENDGDIIKRRIQDYTRTHNPTVRFGYNGSVKPGYTYVNYQVGGWGSTTGQHQGAYSDWMRSETHVPDLPVGTILSDPITIRLGPTRNYNFELAGRTEYRYENGGTAACFAQKQTQARSEVWKVDDITDVHPEYVEYVEIQQNCFFAAPDGIPYVHKSAKYQNNEDYLNDRDPLFSAFDQGKVYMARSLDGRKDYTLYSDTLNGALYIYSYEKNEWNLGDLGLAEDENVTFVSNLIYGI